LIAGEAGRVAIVGQVLPWQQLNGQTIHHNIAGIFLTVMSFFCHAVLMSNVPYLNISNTGHWVLSDWVFFCFSAVTLNPVH